MAQSLVGALTGLYAACTACYANTTAPDGTPVFVAFGDPGQYQPAAIVAVMDVGPSPIQRPTMTPTRSREMVAALTVMFSVYVPGGPEAHQTAAQTVATLLRQLEDYLRVQGNQTLGGACYDAWVSGVTGLVGTVIYDSVNTSSPTGRVVECSATVTSKIRY